MPSNMAYRALGMSPEQIETVLSAASAAPSVHNSQPWRFRFTDDAIELYADARRRLPVIDPDDRELRLACGGALFNLRLGLVLFGIRPLVSLLPDRTKPELLAVVRRGGRMPTRPELTRLLRAIPLRRTNRRPFLDLPVPTAHREALVRAAETERCWLHVADDRVEGAELLHLVRRAHGVQQRDPAFVAELTQWTGHTEQRIDGVSAEAGGGRPEPQGTWALRDFAGHHAKLRVPGKDFESDPLIVLLCSFYDGPRAELQAGQAMQRVLLTATSYGLSASFLSQPIEVKVVREELRRLLGGGVAPQVLLRIGFGSPVPPTPRRPIAELLLADPARR